MNEWQAEELEVMIAPVISTIGMGQGAKSVTLSPDG